MLYEFKNFFFFLFQSVATSGAGRNLTNVDVITNHNGYQLPTSISHPGNLGPLAGLNGLTGSAVYEAK